MTRRSEQDRYLHLIAFITHQFFRLQDNLVDVFVTTVQSAINSAEREHKERCYEQRSARGEAVESLIVQLDRSLKFIQSVDHVSENPELNDTAAIYMNG